MSFKKAEKKGIRARIANIGPTGSGKTYWSLQQAELLAKAYDTKIAFIDTEYGSAKIYADTFDFDVFELYDDFNPQRYMDAMKEAAKNGYGVVVIDSMTHAWDATGGILDKQNRETEKSASKNSYMAWGKVTPLQNAFRMALLEYPGHLIGTMRAKMEYVIEKNSRGKSVPVKVGLAPIQKAGIEHEFTISNEINSEHILCVSGKSRCHLITDEIYRPGEVDKMMTPFIAWLGDYEEESPVDQPIPPSVPPMEVLIPQLKNAIDYMTENGVDGFDVGKRRLASLKKHLNTAEFAVIEKLDNNTVHAYIEHLRAKCGAWKKTEGKK